MLVVITHVIDQCRFVPDFSARDRLTGDTKVPADQGLFRSSLGLPFLADDHSGGQPHPLMTRAGAPEMGGDEMCRYSSASFLLSFLFL